jgi:hypothetical protein
VGVNDPEILTRWPTAALDWTPAYRVVPTRFPAAGLFDRVAPAGDLDALHALEALTDDRIRDEIGVLNLVPPAERRYGPGWGPVMAAFTHPDPQGGRFSDGSYGVFYCAHSRDTAIAETRDHCSRFLAATKAPPMRQQMRLYALTVQGEVVDVRAPRVQHGPVLLDPLDGGAARALGRAVRDAGGAGIVYPSVHDAHGECVAAFHSTVLRDCRHEAYLEYAWNGTAIDAVFELHQVG